MSANRERLYHIPADPDHMLEFMEGLQSDDSDSDFDGYDGQIEDDDYLAITPLNSTDSTSSFQNLPSTSPMLAQQNVFWQLIVYLPRTKSALHQPQVLPLLYNSPSVV